MLLIIGVLIIIALIYFSSRRVTNKEVDIGRRHLENLNQIDPHAREVITKWMEELREELGEDNLDTETLNQLIGLKILQSRGTGELGDDFKELPKSMDSEYE